MTKLTKREIIKNITIVFLVIMLILTFFSKTIMNKSLPEVSTQGITSGSVVTQVRGDGVIEADDPYKVVVEETRKVAGVLKHEGDRVEIGDVIYKLEGETSDELTNAKNEYETLKSTYEINLLGLGLTQAEISTIEAGVTPTTSAILQQLEAKDNAIVAQEKKVEEVKKKVDDLEKQKELSADASVDTSKEEKAVADAQAAYDASKAILDEHDKNRAIVKEYNQLVDDRNYYLGLIEGRTNDPQYADPSKNQPGDPIYDANYEYYLDKANELAIKLNELEREKNEALSKLPSQEDYDKQVADVKAKEANLAQAQKNLENKGNSGDSNSKNINNQIIEAKSDLANKEAELEKLKLDREDYYNKEKTKLEVEKQYQELVKKANDIKDLEAKAIGGTVTSPVAGTLSSVMYTAGEKIEAGSTVAIVQIDGKGYSLSFPVSDKQAKAVKVGDEVSVVDSWFYSDISVNLVAIQPDKNSQRDGKLLVFSISGDGVQPGQRLTLSVGERSSNYDLIVPVNAIREDNKGTFVLIMDTKSTPFGSRYVAKRVDVEVLAKDDKNVAIKAELTGWEYVITNSSKPLQNKDQVKLAE
ncbi:MAG: hypothetical protein MJ126_03945 [Lachnospiraceae bacterium]|nr:hypothetical protein [Lachnospiraceae bacterium]